MASEVKFISFVTYWVFLVALMTSTVTVPHVDHCPVSEWVLRTIGKHAFRNGHRIGIA